MSKVDELREKYKNVNAVAFKFFEDSDSTPTKKYLDYMLKMWDRRAKSNVSITKNKIVVNVIKFDELLSYISIKDIYDSYYNNILHLISEVDKALIKKDEKTFIKNDHIIVINETPRYLLISPKTFRGSLKYGSNTKWCTASKFHEEHFNNYKKGFLVYLIDKSGERKPNYEKIGIYADKSFLPNNMYEIYNASDTRTSPTNLISNGWSRDEIFEIDMYYKEFIRFIGDLRIAKEEVNKVVNFMKTIDLQKFQNNLDKLKITSINNISEVEETIKKFNEKFSSFAVSDLIND